MKTLSSRKLVAFIVGCAAMIALSWHGADLDTIKYVALLTAAALGVQGFLDYRNRQG